MQSQFQESINFRILVISFLQKKKNSQTSDYFSEDKATKLLNIRKEELLKEAR